MIIRQEKPSDFQEIYDFVKIAFQTAKVANGNEQDFVNLLRASGNYIPKLALEAKEGENLVGHIMLTKTCVETRGSKFEVLLLAPLSVALHYRNRGVGSRLVRKSFELAKSMEYRAVFVVGDPAYYSRFGFISSALVGIKHLPQIPDQYVMVCELTSGSLTGIYWHRNFHVKAKCQGKLWLFNFSQIEADFAGVNPVSFDEIFYGLINVQRVEEVNEFLIDSIKVPRRINLQMC